MTATEIIRAGLSYYLNQGNPAQLSDSFLRKKAHFLLTKVTRRVANSAPYWWKFSSSTVTLTSGEGNLPSDFSHMGTQGRVYTLADGGRVVEYAPPEIVRHKIVTSPQSGDPWIYTFEYVSGVRKLLCYPTNSSTLYLYNYVRTVPELIDAPLAPSPTATVSAGLPNGTYSYVVTNVTSSGETEGGEVSADITVSSLQVSVLIPASPHLSTLTSRKLYRTAASGNQHKLVATITVATAPAHLDYTYTDNIAANVPLPSAAVSGIEVIPVEFHDSAIYDGLVFLLASSQDDGRTPALSADWDRSVKRMWEELQPGRNDVHAMPAFPFGGGGGQGSTHPVWSWLKVPR
jgi:hypothetical protein